MLEAKQFTTPIGRLLGGSVSKANEKAFDGSPLTIKTGPNAGQPTQRYSFGVGFPKNGTSHWSQLGGFAADIWATGHAQMPNHAAHKDFSWKVHDGDSAEVNKKGNKPCENEGWPGHWVFFFSSSYPPNTYNGDGSKEVPAESIKNGHFVQVAGSVIGNESVGNPGVYLNHNMVAHSGFGPEIKGGPDPSAAGFGKNVQAPAGMSAAPVGGLSTGAPPVNRPPAPLPPPVAPPAPLPPPITVVPSPSFIAPPPGVAPPPPAAPARVWKEAGTTYEQYVAAGWNDDQMRATGKLA
jgi:hypothetical protein